MVPIIPTTAKPMMTKAIGIPAGAAAGSSTGNVGRFIAGGAVYVGSLVGTISI